MHTISPLARIETLNEHTAPGIVITDLDSSEDEAEAPLQTSTGDDRYSVSPALLSRISASKVSTPLIADILPTPEQHSSQALVLFRSSPWSAKDARELEGIYRARDDDKHRHHQDVPLIEEPADADAMEIE